MEKKLKILPPTMPNFYRYEAAPVKRQDGLDTKDTHPISEFTYEEAIEFGEMMKQEFIAHHKREKEKSASEDLPRRRHD